MVARSRPGCVQGEPGLPANRGVGWSRGLGELRPRVDARLPLGRLPLRARTRSHDCLRRPSGRRSLAGGAWRVPRRSAPPRRRPGRHRAGVGRAAATPLPDGALALRHAQPVPGQRRRRPTLVGDGLPVAPLLRPRRSRRSGRDARAELGRSRQSAHPRCLQRGDTRLAVVLHVHLLHRPRRQVPAGLAARVGLRPALAHLRLHVEGGGTPHVRRRHRCRARGRTYGRADEGARHRRRHTVRWHQRRRAPEVHQLPLQRLTRSVRSRNVHERRELLRGRAQGSLQGGVPRRRSPAPRPHANGSRRRWRPDHRARGADAERPQRDPSRGLPRGLPGWAAPVEPDSRRRRSRADVAAHRFQPRLSVRSATTMSARMVAWSTKPSGRPTSVTGCRPPTTVPMWSR